MSFTVRPLSPEHAARVDKMFDLKNALVEFNPGRCLLPPHHVKFAQQIIDAPVRKDDVWLVSFPRTGSTWCQEMIWLIGNDLDFDTARNTIQHIRVPFIEMSTIAIKLGVYSKDLLENSVEYVDKLPSPRYIRSHLPLPLLPAQLEEVKPRIIYTCRNPKDMCVSLYLFYKTFRNLQISFEEFCEQLILGLTPLGSVFDHYLSFWNKRHESNVLFLKYEDMKRDLCGTLRKIAKFMDKSLSEEDYDKLCDFLSFQNMKRNKGCNREELLEYKYGKDFLNVDGDHFIRKGQIGDWKNHMSPELAKRFDDWIEKNTRGTGLNWD